MNIMKNTNQPTLCYSCIHRKDVFYSHHSECSSKTAEVTGVVHGIKNGWFFWPLDFDPIWVNECDGYEEKK